MYAWLFPPVSHKKRWWWFVHADACTGCRIGCDAFAACPFGCTIDPVTGGEAFCSRGCDASTGDFFERSNPRVCTTDIRDYADGVVNMRCISGWRKKSGDSLFGCRPDVPSRTCMFLCLRGAVCDLCVGRP